CPSTLQFDESQTFRVGYHVGYIAQDRLDWLKEKLREVFVIKDDDDWDCQSWVMQALQLFKEEGGGFITENIGRAHIFKELIMEEERW
ncbi:hypothetical protein BT96DRAFT_818564, partial [Gymnopus androsaceus JB14]